MSDIISVSLPSELRKLLDAEASRQRRSRSFIVQEAIRAYVAQSSRESFAAGRDQTLREGLALNPAERIRLAEDLWEELSWGHKPARGWTASFDTFDEYVRWRTRRGSNAA